MIFPLLTIQDRQSLAIGAYPPLGFPNAFHFWIVGKEAAAPWMAEQSLTVKCLILHFPLLDGGHDAGVGRLGLSLRVGLSWTLFLRASRLGVTYFILKIRGQPLSVFSSLFGRPCSEVDDNFCHY